jgi:hypothetical protein
MLSTGLAAAWGYNVLIVFQPVMWRTIALSPNQWSSSSPCQARRFAFSLGLNHEYLVVKLTHFQRDFVVECAGLASTRFHIRTGDIVLKMIL